MQFQAPHWSAHWFQPRIWENTGAEFFHKTKNWFCLSMHLTYRIPCDWDLMLRWQRAEMIIFLTTPECSLRQFDLPNAKDKQEVFFPCMTSNTSWLMYFAWLMYTISDPSVTGWTRKPPRYTKYPRIIQNKCNNFSGNVSSEWLETNIRGALWQDSNKSERQNLWQ